MLRHLSRTTEYETIRKGEEMEEYFKVSLNVTF